MPSTSVLAKYNFSRLKRIKTYLRNIIFQEWLSSLSIISVQKERIEQLKNKEIIYNKIINIYMVIKKI